MSKNTKAILCIILGIFFGAFFWPLWYNRWAFNINLPTNWSYNFSAFVYHLYGSVGAVISIVLFLLAYLLSRKSKKRVLKTTSLTLLILMAAVFIFIMLGWTRNSTPKNIDPGMSPPNSSSLLQ
jgi:quinol-cytochrome oxidoreductase complex cytochrome b subunit